MPSLEAAIFSTIGLQLQLPQEKWPGGLPQQNITDPPKRNAIVISLTCFGAVVAKTLMGGLILQ